MMDKCCASGFCADYRTTVSEWGGELIPNPLVLLFVVTEEWLWLESQSCLSSPDKPQTGALLSVTPAAKTAPTKTTLKSKTQDSANGSDRPDAHFKWLLRCSTTRQTGFALGQVHSQHARID